MYVGLAASPLPNYTFYHPARVDVGLLRVRSLDSIEQRLRSKQPQRGLHDRRRLLQDAGLRSLLVPAVALCACGRRVVFRLLRVHLTGRSGIRPEALSTQESVQGRQITETNPVEQEL